MTLSDDTGQRLTDAINSLNNTVVNQSLLVQRLNDRMDAVEKRHEQEDMDKREREKRSWVSNQNAPEGIRGNLSIIISLGVLLVYIIPHIHLN